MIYNLEEKIFFHVFVGLTWSLEVFNIFIRFMLLFYNINFPSFKADIYPPCSPESVDWIYILHLLSQEELHAWKLQSDWWYDC